MTVAAILKHKGAQVTSVEPTATVAEVIRTLTERRIGAVLVIDRADQVLGIVSERDIVCALAVEGSHMLEMTAGQLMTCDLHTVAPDTTVIEAMQLITESRVRHLPVLHEGRLAGIISIGDVVKARIMQQAQEVESLRAYVAGAA
jgi:CBS domain-containing protein